MRSDGGCWPYSASSTTLHGKRAARPRRIRTPGVDAVEVEFVFPGTVTAVGIEP